MPRASAMSSAPSRAAHLHRARMRSTMHRPGCASFALVKNLPAPAALFQSVCVPLTFTHKAAFCRQAASAGRCLSWKPCTNWVHTSQRTTGPCKQPCGLFVRYVFLCGKCIGRRFACSSNGSSIRLVRCFALCATRHANALTVMAAIQTSRVALHPASAVCHRCNVVMERAAHLPRTSSASYQRREQVSAGQGFHASAGTMRLQDGYISTVAHSLFQRAGKPVLLERALKPFDAGEHTGRVHRRTQLSCCCCTSRVKSMAAVDVSGLHMHQDLVTRQVTHAPPRWCHCCAHYVRT